MFGLFQSKWDQLGQRILPSTPQIMTPIGKGSAVVVREDGLILTNHHVVENCQLVRVRFPSGECSGGILVHYTGHDLALVKIHANPPELPAPLTLSKTAPQSGDHVLAAGHPGKEGEELGTDFNTLTGGVVVGQKDIQVGDDDRTLRCIEFEGKIRGGNSGGPMVNEQGELCGLIVASTQDQKQGYAVPPEDIKDFLEQAFEQVDAGTLTIPPAEVLDVLPWEPTALGAVKQGLDDAKMHMVSSRTTEHHQGAHRHEFVIKLAPHMHCNMSVQEKGGEDAPVGDLHLYADVLPARSNVYEDLPLLQALLRFNDRTSSAKVVMREDGGIRLAIRRPSDALDTSEVQHALEEMRLHLGSLPSLQRRYGAPDGTHHSGPSGIEDLS